MTKKARNENVETLKVEQLENRDAPSVAAVMRRLDDLGRGGGDIIIRNPDDANLE